MVEANDNTRVQVFVSYSHNLFGWKGRMKSTDTIMFFPPDHHCWWSVLASEAVGKDETTSTYQSRFRC